MGFVNFDLCDRASNELRIGLHALDAAGARALVSSLLSQRIFFGSQMTGTLQTLRSSGF